MSSCWRSAHPKKSVRTTSSHVCARKCCHCCRSSLRIKCYINYSVMLFTIYEDKKSESSWHTRSWSTLGERAASLDWWIGALSWWLIETVARREHTSDTVLLDVLYVLLASEPSQLHITLDRMKPEICWQEPSNVLATIDRLAPAKSSKQPYRTQTPSSNCWS